MTWSLPVPPGDNVARLRPVDLVKRGQTIEVIDDQGQEIRGKVRALSAEALTLDRKGTPTEIPFERITQIARPNDGLGNGALIGLGGVAFGLLGSTVAPTAARAWARSNRGATEARR